MSEDKIGKGITSISRGMKYQKLSTPKGMKPEEGVKYKKYDITLNGRVVQVLYDGNGGVIIDGKLYQTEIIEDVEEFFVAKVKVTSKQSHHYKIEHHEGRIYLEGREVLFDFKPSIPKLIRKKASIVSGEDIRAPLPGIIISIPVKIGDVVKSGQVMAIIEAMKMQNDILCSVDGVIKDIKIAEGDQVVTDQLILVIGKKKIE